MHTTPRSAMSSLHCHASLLKIRNGQSGVAATVYALSSPLMQDPVNAIWAKVSRLLIGGYLTATKQNGIPEGEWMTPLRDNPQVPAISKEARTLLQRVCANLKA